MAASCPMTDVASTSGSWNDELKGHGPFIRDRLEGNDDTCANPRLIDSLEDGTPAACQRSTFPGRWFVANDGTGTQTPITAAGLAVVPTVSRYGSALAVHTIGSGFDTVTGWGAIMGVVLNDDAGTPVYFNGSSFAGLRFHARGSGTVDVRISTGRTSEPANSGYCVGDACNSHFTYPLSLSTGDWVPHLIRFEWFESAELGSMNATDLAQMISVEFSTASASFDIWVDDLGFY
jgi:hypothetical protein